MVPATGQAEHLPEQLQARREVEVLAGLLQYPAQCAQVLKWLPPRAFTPGPHREIYEALRAVARTGAPVDALTVAWQLCMRQAAEDTVADADASGLWPGQVVTKISEAGPFWEAGAEDQEYLQHYPGGKNQFRP